MKSKTLSGLEQEVMNIVWEARKCTVRDVLVKLNEKKHLAYTTAATVLQRLYEKGLVKRQNHQAYLVYTPKLTKDSYSRSLAKSFLNKFVSSFGNSAIASFVDSIESLPKDKREYFLRLLEKYDNSS